jgi:hypothetical protein
MTRHGHVIVMLGQNVGQELGLGRTILDHEDIDAVGVRWFLGVH